MEVPRLGVQSELELPAYATATATSWFLVRFASAVPQQELLLGFFLFVCLFKYALILASDLFYSFFRCHQTGDVKRLLGASE